MGDRFYQQQLNAIGVAPGARPKRKKSMSDWTDESRTALVEQYQSNNPTPENTTEIVAALAEELGKSPNGVRMILQKAGVYVTKAAGAAASSKSTSSGGGRASKQAQIDRLTAAITSAGHTVDDAIVSKLTGKAAGYFADIIGGADEDE